MPILNALFGGRGYETKRYSQGLGDYGEELVSALRGATPNILGAGNQYLGSITRHQPRAGGYLKQLEDVVSGNLGRNDNALNTLSGIRDILLAPIDREGGAISQVARDNANRIGLTNLVHGINPGVGSYSNRVATDAIARARLGYISDALKGLGTLFPSAITGQLAYDTNRLGMPLAELGALGAVEGRPLAGAQGLLGLFGGLGGAGGGILSNIIKPNISGYEKRTNFFDRFDTGLQNLLSDAERVTSLYGNIAGMGGGGMGGMGGQQSRSAGGFIPSSNPYASALNQTANTAERLGPGYLGNYGGPPPNTYYNPYTNSSQYGLPAYGMGPYY